MTKLSGRLAAFVLSLSSGSVFAADYISPFFKCSSYKSEFMGKNVNYCHDRSRPDLPQLPGEPVVYFMHGAFMSAKQWYTDDYSGVLKEIAVDEEFPPFTVISFDTNHLSFFSDEADVHEGKRAFETWFLTEFVPFIENKMDLCRARDCRGVMGSSMGGFGSLKTVLRHPELFAFGGSNFPAILPANIYDRTLDEWKEYFSHTKIGGGLGKQFIEELRQRYPTPELYDAHDPVVLAARWPASQAFPPIYFDVGAEDQFGFYDGHNRFKQVLNERRFPYSAYFDLDGDHFTNSEMSYSMLRWVAGQVKGTVTRH